jgi:hypothetical protein
VSFSLLSEYRFGFMQSATGKCWPNGTDRPSGGLKMRAYIVESRRGRAFVAGGAAKMPTVRAKMPADEAKMPTGASKSWADTQKSRTGTRKRDRPRENGELSRKNVTGHAKIVNCHVKTRPDAAKTWADTRKRRLAQ